MCEIDSTDGVSEVLFVCVHNAGRSQMAAALLERSAGDKVRVISAGSEPADQLNPAVIEAMGCGDACPIYRGKRYEDWELEDPAGKDLETVRRIRDEIGDRVDELIGSLASG